MRTITIKYETIEDFKYDEDLRIKGRAFEELDTYFRKIIKYDGAEGVLASINLEHKLNLKAAVDVVYKLSDHFRKHMDNIYKDQLE